MKVYISLLGFILVLLSTSYGQSFNLLPTIPDYANNPQAAVMWKGVQLTNPPFSTILTPSLYDEVWYASMAYFHPQSPYYHNPLALKRTQTLLDSMLTDWSNNLYTTSFNYAVEANYAYLLLKTYLPDSIPSDRKPIWEKGIANLITATLKNSLLYDSSMVGSVWLNGDIRFAIAAVLGGTAIGDTASVAKARNVIENVMTKCLLGDGGTHYYGYQNENFNYHTPTKKYLFIYWLISQNQSVLNVLKGMNHYPLLMQHPIGKGFGEYIATPAWKPYYNSNTLEYAAAISAYLTSDPYSWTIGKNVKAFELAFIWKNGLNSLPLPTSFALYDKNILGPRYRIGNWGAVGTLRDVASALPELKETNVPLATLSAGKQTFAGAYALTANASATTYPMNSVFQAAAITVKTKTGKETDYNRGNVNSFLSAFENNSITKTRSVYGMATRYKVVDKGLNKTSFDGMQQWVFTQDRIVGMIELEAMANTSCYGLGTRFCFVGGRLGVSGKYKQLVRLNDSTYQYGLLNFKVINQDLKGRTDSVYYGIQGVATDTLSNQLTLHDKLDSVTDKKINITKGYRKKVLVEVTKSTNPFAADASVLNIAYPLYGFQFNENNNRKLRIVHNTAATSVNYTDTFFCNFNKTRLIKSWDDTDTSTLNANANGLVSINITIPANSHILIINSSLATDTVLGFNTFDSVFVGSATLPVHNLVLNGTCKNCRTTINLTVTNETNAACYQLQASKDGYNFTNISSLPAHNSNNNSSVNRYSFEVNPALGSFSFYRIKTIDNDGNSIYSEALFVENDCNTADYLTIYPNPSKGSSLQLEYGNSSVTAKGTLRLFNTSGKTVWKKEIGIVEGKNHFTIPAANFPAGQYFVQLALNNGKVITKQTSILR